MLVYIIQKGLNFTMLFDDIITGEEDVYYLRKTFAISQR